MNILIFGAGAVGGSLAAWLKLRGKEVWLYDQPQTVSSIISNGLTIYPHNDSLRKEHCKPKAFSRLEELPAKPDVVFLCVKNFSLDGVCALLKSTLGDVPVVGFQNGVENQKILPRYFSQVVYGIVAYNAWLDSPNVVGYQKKGPLALGVLHEATKPLALRLCDYLNQAVPTEFVERFQDAAHSKMVVNLTNSLTTLIGHGFRPVDNPQLFQKILSSLTYEGVCILRAAGYKEYRLGGMPSWLLMTLAAKLPLWMTRRAFQKNIKKMVISSMAQDIIQRGATTSELDSLNGYFLSLAERHGVNAVYNRAIYELCVQHFKPGFKPISISQVWQRIQKELEKLPAKAVRAQNPLPEESPSRHSQKV